MADSQWENLRWSNYRRNDGASVVLPPVTQRIIDVPERLVVVGGQCKPFRLSDLETKHSPTAEAAAGRNEQSWVVTGPKAWLRGCQVVLENGILFAVELRRCSDPHQHPESYLKCGLQIMETV